MGHFRILLAVEKAAAGKSGCRPTPFNVAQHSSTSLQYTEIHWRYQNQYRQIGFIFCFAWISHSNHGSFSRTNHMQQTAYKLSKPL